MEAEGILTVLAEVAIAIAGFSGIAVALQGRSGSWSETDKLRFSMLLQVSLSCVFWSLVPIVLHLIYASEPFVWSWSSGIWLFSIICLVSYRIRQRPRIPDQEADQVYRAARVFIFSLLGISVLLQIANVGWLRIPWPHVVTVMLGLLITAFLFIRLLRRVVEPAAQQADEADVE